MNAGGAAIPSRAISFLSFAAFASGANLRVCDALLPQIAGDFSVTVGRASIVVSAFSVTYAVLQAFFGPLGDRLGKYRVICWATFASGGGILICALAPSLGVLTAGRVLTALGGAAIIPLSMAWIGDVVAYDARQGVLARFLGGQIMGFILGQSIGGIIGDHLGWRAAFLALLAAHLAAAIGLLIELRRNPDKALFAPSAAAPAGIGAALRGLIAITRRPWVPVVLFSVCAEGVLIYGALAFAGAHLKATHDLSYTAIGALLAFFGGGGLLYAVTAQRLVTRLGEAGLAQAGGALAGLALLALAFLPSAAAAAGAIFVLGLGFYMLHNTLQTNATQMAPQARGAAVAVFAQVFFLGQAAGVWANGLVVDRFGAVPGFVLAACALPALGFWLARRIRARAAGAPTN